MDRQIKITPKGSLIEEVTVSEGSPSVTGDAIPKEEDMVNSPYHYQSYNKELNIECIDAMRAAFGDDVVSAFCICNVFKYTWRHQSKNGKQDLEKAQWYLNKYLELNK